MQPWSRDREVEKPKRREVHLLYFKDRIIGAFRRKTDAETARDSIINGLDPQLRVTLWIFPDHFTIKSLELK